MVQGSGRISQVQKYNFLLTNHFKRDLCTVTQMLRLICNLSNQGIQNLGLSVCTVYTHVQRNVTATTAPHDEANKQHDRGPAAGRGGGLGLKRTFKISSPII